MKKKISKPLVLHVTKTVMEAIESFWHKRKFRSKSEAVRELITYGLDNIDQDGDDVCKPPSVREKK